MALFLDFDGTLAPLQDDAQAVALPDGLDRVLTRLKSRLGLGPILISGRDLDDLSTRTPHSLHRIGNHGLRQAVPGAASDVHALSPPPGLADPLTAIMAAHPGSFAEPKASVIAVHYRAAPEHADGLRAALSALPLSAYGYHLEAGKMIFELKPDGASKGAALSRVMADYPDLTPVMFGDDTTDEAAMSAAQELGGLGIKVGAGETVADMRLNTCQAVHTLLRQWAAKI